LCVVRAAESEAPIRQCEPLSSLAAVLLIGRHSVTTPALHALLKADVPTYFADSRGRYLGSTQSSASAQQLNIWALQQQRFRADPAFCLLAAKSVVQSRIRHQRELLRQRQLSGASKPLDELARALLDIDAAQNLSVLNGIEGSAAAVFFQSIKTIIPAEFGFAGRARRPPPDPFNALLSLGYTQLYAHVDCVLRSQGLLTSLGFYHQGRGSHAALASDLMEPFRHLVERTALSLLRRGQLKVQEFQQVGGSVSLFPSAKRQYLAALEQRFAEAVRSVHSDVAMDLHQHVRLQAQRLIAALQGKAAFVATLLR
jgi:CRISP-associated protein Cas1